MRRFKNNFWCAFIYTNYCCGEMFYYTRINPDINIMPKRTLYQSGFGISEKEVDEYTLKPLSRIKQFE